MKKIWNILTYLFVSCFVLVVINHYTMNKSHRILLKNSSTNSLGMSRFFKSGFNIGTKNISKFNDDVPQEKFNATNDTITKFKNTMHKENSKYVDVKSRTADGRPKIIITGGGFLLNETSLNMDRYKDKMPVIPHIIHQYWDDYMVPDIYLRNIRTIVNNHPHWEYWLWTNKDVYCYFKTKHPEFYPIFLKYPKMIFRADAMRYFVVADFGGFYLDLDMEVLKPLDIWTHISTCVISYETYEHSYILHKRNSPNLINAAFAAEPKHPFIKLLTESLKLTADNEHLLEATGPFFMDRYYQQFRKSHNDTNSKLLPLHPDHWFPTHGPLSSNALKENCPKITKQPINIKPHQISRAICQRYLRDKHNKPNPESYLNHHWVHTYMATTKPLLAERHHVKTVAPNVVNVSRRLNLVC